MSTPTHTRLARWRGRLLFSIAALGLGAAVFGLQQLGYWSAFEARLQDKLLPDRDAAKNIVIVAIDNDSIQKIGRWPWDRAMHAKLLDFLSGTTAKVIGYDVTFSEASTEPDDAALEAAIKRNGRVFLASESRVWRGEDGILRGEHTLKPLERFRRAAQTANGSPTTLWPGADGVVREAPLGPLGERAGNITGFAAHLAIGFSRRAGQPLVLPYDDAGVFSSLGQHPDGGLYRIPFVSPTSRYRTVSFAHILDGNVREAFFDDTIVLIGSTAPDLHDEYLVPRRGGRMMPGVEIQANIVQGLLDGIAIRTLPTKATFLIYWLLAGTALLWTAALRLRFALPALGLLAGLYALAMIIAGDAYLLLPVIYPYLALALAAAAGIAYKYRAEKRQRTFISEAFSRYLSPKLIEQLVAGKAKLELGGTSAELTILFSDIRSFTTISEKLTPPELVALLNEYLSAMTDIILDEGGTVDKYIGDAIMAFWGAPLPLADHAARAARTALRMRSKLIELQAKWRDEGKPEVNIGIGLNTGTVVVGNMGSKQRFDYTVMGDDVNLASRLEGLTKQYKVTTLITEATRLKLGDGFITRPIDRVAVKGKKLPVQIHELLGTGHEPAGTSGELIARFKEAQELYAAREWDRAAAAFTVLATQLRDGVSSVFAERCNYMKRHDPGPGWDGTFVAKEK